jgi:hypothetical protein
MLYLDNGQLVEAETGELKHLEAAYAIIGWDNVTIEIEKTEGFPTREINIPLMQILMESLQQKDEGEYDRQTPSPAAKEKKTEPRAKHDAGVTKAVSKSGVETEAGPAKLADVETIVPIEIEAKEQKAPAKKEGMEREPPSEKDDDLIDLDLVETTERERKLLKKKAERKKLAGMAVKPKSKKKKMFITLGVIAVVAVGAFLAYTLFLGQPRLSDYEILLAKLSQVEDWGAKEQLLMAFIDTHEPGEETEKVEIMLQDAIVKTEDAYYQKTSDKVNALPLDGDYQENAKKLYAQFLERYPNSRYRIDIENNIPRIAKLSDDIHFSQLKNIRRNAYIERLQAYESYLTTFPNGQHRDGVKTLMQDAVSSSYHDFKKRIQACEKAETWQACIQICDDYSSGFQSYLPTDAIQPIKRQMASRRDYEALMADVAGVDDASAQKMYLAYMKKYPEAEENESIRTALARMDQKDSVQREWESLKTKVRETGMDPAAKMDILQDYILDNTSGPFVQEARAMLKQLELENVKLAQERYQAAQRKKAEDLARKEEAARQAAQLKIQREKDRIAQAKKKVIAALKKGGRFVVTKGDMATDQRTGLTWALLDSHLERGQCMNYRSAVQYVKGLRYGGYSDWRLPTSGELAGIYKNSPFFPGSGAEWYWTSESFAKGYHEQANIVTSKQETMFKKQSIRTDACGAVRAVRR